MTEIIIVLAATILVFALFLLVFLNKSRTEDDAPHIPTCANCNCHRNQEQLDRSLKHLKDMGK